MEKFLHFFIPHPQTHKKARLISWQFLLIYLLLFILLRASFELINIYQPGVLGINSNITVAKIIEETNKERQKNGLAPLRENSALSQAAISKAANMFEENYWAHFAPSGKDPWGFITASGYKFSYAGENLARNFYNSEDVVQAWMNSPSHRDNILNSSYEDIGIAVVDGNLSGQKTTLVVQMFGKTYQPLAAAPAPAQVDLGGQKIEVSPSPAKLSSRMVLSSAQNLSTKPATIDSFTLTKIVGFSLLLFISILTALDLLVLYKRGVFRISSHHVAHLSFLSLGSASLFLHKAGEIL